MGGRQAGRQGEGGHRASGRQGRTRSEQAGNECAGAQDDDADKEEEEEGGGGGDTCDRTRPCLTFLPTCPSQVGDQRIGGS